MFLNGPYNTTLEAKPAVPKNKMKYGMGEVYVNNALWVMQRRGCRSVIEDLHNVQKISGSSPSISHLKDQIIGGAKDLH